MKTVKLRLANKRALLKEAYGRYIRKRLSRLYCVGTAKSGTHSIDSMFTCSVRTRHEPDSLELIRKVLAFANGEIFKEELVRFVVEKDRKYRLDVDSSQLNFFVLEYLLEEFPDALFLLTIRDCYSWLNSFVNDSMRREVACEWHLLRDFRFGKRDEYPPEEYVLKENGLYTLDGYLSYWAMHNSRVLAMVPPERLMIVKTSEITARAIDIARFAGLPDGAIDLGRSHAFQNPHKFGLLESIDADYVESKVRHHCGHLMDKYFPEIRGFPV